MNQQSFVLPPKTLIMEKYQTVMDRIHSIHIKAFPGYPEPLFLISNAYPGVWLEHAYDAICWAQLEPSMAYVARAQIRLFLDNQKDDGQFPCYVLDESNPNTVNYGNRVGYGQIQECVSFTQLCLETFQLTKDRELLKDAYEKCVKWDRWLVSNRMTLNSGLIELFCEHDTGHDNSRRLADVPKGCPKGNAKILGGGKFMPLRAPDMNAVFYRSRVALSEMAELLGKTDEAKQWLHLAQEVKDALLRICYDEEDDFFYDVDRFGNKRKYRSIMIANLFQERVLDQEMADRIYEKHMKNPEEFWTPYPFPSMAISDPASVQDRDGNSWGFYSQGLTALRALRWMDYYGKGEDLEYLMKRWISALVQSEDMQFSQELHPITGKLSKSSQWYSSCMLFFICAVRRLGLAEGN